MTKDKFWILAFCLPTVAVLTVSPLPEHKTYVTDALSQNAFVIKTWTYRGPSLVVTVTKGNQTLLSEFFHGVSFMKQENRLFIKYNKSREEVSLLLNNVTRDDEGLYQISSGIFQKAANVFNPISKTWNVQINVLEPSEIKQGYAGENILITEFLQESIFFPRLYHNDQHIAVLRGSDCDVSTNSPFYGRIRCSKDTENNTTRIEINHVTENDTGLFTMKTESSLTQRCFLNITGIYTYSVSALIIVTPPERFDENNSDQTRNVTLPATVRSCTAVNRAHSTNGVLKFFCQEPGEIKHGYSGETILIIEFVQKSKFVPRLYHNDKLIAVWIGTYCDVNTNSPFYGRIRCLKNKDNNTTRFEVKSVTENDMGLYKAETEGNLTVQCFLNITGTFTNSASELISVTQPERFDGIISDQPSNIPLPTTVISRAFVNLARLNTDRELIYILPITTVAVFAIILFLGSLIWIQRRNIKSFKAVQRIVLETMETASSAAFSTLGRCPQTPSREEIWTSNANSLENTFTNPAGRLLYPTSKVSTSGHISCINNTQQLDDDYYKSDVTDTILKICQSRSRSNKTLLAKCHECPGSLIDACPFPSDAFSATEREEHLDRRICNANGQCQLTANTEATYAVVKKSSRNNVKAGNCFKDGYEMVNFSHFDNPTNGVQDVVLALASETPNPTFVDISTSLVDLDPDTEDEEANTLFSNVMNHEPAENVMSYDEEKAFNGRKEEQGEEIALSGRKEEQGEQKQNTIHVIVCNHDAINPK